MKLQVELSHAKPNTKMTPGARQTVHGHDGIRFNYMILKQSPHPTSPRRRGGVFLRRFELICLRIIAVGEFYSCEQRASHDPLRVGLERDFFSMARKRFLEISLAPRLTMWLVVTWQSRKSKSY